MRANGRCIRGFLLVDLIRASQRESVDPSEWIDRQQALRLAALAHGACDGDWSRFHELCVDGVERLSELGYRKILRVEDPEQTFAALSVLWRASFSYGRALADTDSCGATIHMIEVDLNSGEPDAELEGHLYAGWCLGVARLIGLADAGLELRRRPWACEGDEQVVRLHWRRRARLDRGAGVGSPAAIRLPRSMIAPLRAVG